MAGGGVLPMIPLFGFELLSPAMLGWLAAAAAPILIHLWSRQRYREMTWAAMEYLLRAIQASRRRVRLEQWILLAVRTLIVVLVVLAVADPLLESAVFVSARGERTHRVLVLDASFSMAYRSGKKTRFDRAKEIAAQIVDESSQGDGFTLVLLSAPPRVVVGTPALDPRDFRKEIDQLELLHTGADLPKTLTAVEQALVRARRDAPRLTREEVYFLTDLGRVGWGLDRLDAATLDEFRRRSRRLADAARLVVIDLGQSDAENAAVTDVRLGETVAALQQPVEIQAEVRYFGGRVVAAEDAAADAGDEGGGPGDLRRRAREGLPVELWIDGRRVDRTTLRVQPGGKASVSFPWRFDAPGDHLVEVRIEGDGLDVDNHRWLVVPVKDRIRVLCVDGRPSGDPYRSGTGYLAAALAPSGGIVRPEVVPESRLREAPLGQYDCVFLADVAQATSAEARILDSYVRAGGSVVFFLGPQVQAANYNRELAGETPDGVRLLPARLGEVVERDPQKTRLDPRDYRHPIVRPFEGQEAAGLLTTPVFKHFKLVVPSDSAANVVLGASEGDPLIVEEAIHRGRVVLVATAAGDTAWSALPLWPSFVPLVQEMLNYAIAGQIDERNVLVGEPLGGAITASGETPTLVVATPSGRAEEVRLRTETDSRVWTFPETWQSGAYTARFGAPLSRSDLYAVNVDSREPAESDLETITPEQLREDVWPDVPLVHQATFQNLDQPEAGPVAQQNRLAKGLLYAVLGLLLVETYLAWRIGHHGEAASGAPSSGRRAA